MIILTLEQIMAGSGEPIPDKPPVLVVKGPKEEREWWRVWEPAPVKEARTCRYRLIMKAGRDM